MEKQQGRVSVILCFLGKVVLIDLGIFAAVGLLCWFAGWHTAYQYGLGLVWAGIGAMAVGASSILGNWGLTRTGAYQYSMSAGGQSIQERTRQATGESKRSYGLFGLMAAVGGIAFIIGSVIQTIAS